MNARSRCAHSLGAAFLLTALLPASLTAGTDANGFFDTYLTAIGYDAAGAAPAAAEFDQDYLCDGFENESDIVPELGMVLGDPLVAFPDDCGDLPLANRGFDLDALLVGGELPIREDLVTTSTLDFQAISRTETGIADLVPTNVMAYAWVYATNHTAEPLRLNMGIGSDDSIQVKVNRVEVFRHMGGRGSGGNNTVQDRFPVVLQPGPNLIQFKVWQGSGGWNMRARFEESLDCPATSRLPRPFVPSDGITLTVDTVPPAGDLPTLVPATRSVVTSGVSPEPVTAEITVQLDNGGLPWDLVETFDEGWELVSATPVAASSSPGQATWQGVTADTITYTLSRSDVWNAEDGGVSGLNTLESIEAVVGGETTIPGGLAPYVPQVLLTAPLNLADFDDQGAPVDVTGCNVTEAQITGPWIVGEDIDGNPIDDANIIPEEGLEIAIDFGGLEGGASQGDFLSFSPEAEARFWAEPGNNLGNMILQPATSGDGYYDFQRADIFGAVDQTMAVAYFYALNTEAEPRTLVLAFGSDDSGGVRVNGRTAHAITACRGVPPFETADRFEVQLDPGKNLIACYAFEASGGVGIRVRFEDERFRAIRVPTTINPAGYDPAAHPDPGPLETFPQLSVGAILATAAFDISGTGFHGSNIPAANIAGEWITGEDGLGNPVDDASIVPSEGMQLFPDFGGDSQATGLLEIAQSAKDVFWTDPFDALGSGTNIVRLTSGDGYYDWQRGDIFTASPDPNVTMNVAWFYAINDEPEPRCVTLSFGSDDSGGVRVNGRVVHTITLGRGVPAFGATDQVPVQLDPGKNLISCYTFDNTGGWGLRVRFEDGQGNPIIVETTTDPTGYDPDPAAHPEPQCAPVRDGYVRDGGAANGIITEFLVPIRPFEHGNSGGGTVADAAPENYISAEGGDVLDIDGVFEGARVAPGIAGVEDPSKVAITTAVRNAPCGVTKLVRFDGLVDGDGAADPGDFNAEVYYRDRVQTSADHTQISTTMFCFVENLTASALPAWFAFASDDGGTLYLNGEWVAEYLPGRGRGGNNVLQTFATDSADLVPGLNLVQFSFKQGGGGVGARVGFFADDCFSTAFGDDQVHVSANPPGFTPQSLVSATREVSSFGCDNTGTVTLTIHIPGGGSANVNLLEVLPAGIAGSNPSAGSFDASGSTLTFSGQASDGMQITYNVSEIALGGSFCESNIDDNLIDGDQAFTEDTCRERCLPLSDTGGIPEMLIIGPIDAGGNTSNNGLCDDNGNLATTDYLAGPEFDETDIAVGLGDEIAPDFGGDAGGVGVKASPNPEINPRAAEGILTTYLGRADNEGRINFNQSTLIGDPVDDYIVYGLTYLDNLGDVRDVTLEVASDDSIKVLVNGELLHVNSICRAIPGYGAGDRVLATLQPGRNTVLIAVVERGGGTDMRLVVRDGFDVPITDGSIVACRLGEEGPPPTGGFRRGDVDANGVLEITDPINNLSFQFLGTFDPFCMDALDFDDNGRVEITDPIGSLSHQFLGQAAPPAPGKENCGPDPTPDDGDGDGTPGEPNDDLGCETYPSPTAPPAAACN